MARPTPLPPAISGDALALTQIVHFLGQKCQFGWYYRQGVAAPTAADAGINVAALNRAWLAVQVPNIQGCISIGTRMDESRVWSMKWPNVATNILSSGGIFGTRPGDPLPPQIALVFSKSTLTRGRSGRGRSYLCGMSETDSTNGAPDPAFNPVAIATAAVLNGPITDVVSGRTFTPVVVSIKNYQLIAPPPVFGPFWTVLGDDIVHVTPEIIWNTQRRRTIGVGQ
jgi:hypothetical protein